MWEDVIVVRTPALAFSPGVGKAGETVGRRAFRSELVDQARDEDIVRRFAWPREVSVNVASVCTEVEVLRDELQAFVDTDRLRQTDRLTNHATAEATH